MAISRQIKCVNKIDRQERHESIKNIGGDWGKVSEFYAITLIENDTYNYYTLIENNKANVVIMQHEGRKYLKTDADTTALDNLLSLPECP